MQNLNTINQNPNKIVTGPGLMIGSLTCYYNDEDKKGVNIQLTSLEEMWYTHEENVNHPAGSEYPESINVPHMKVMRDRVMASVLARTGHDITQFDGVIHASTMPAKDSDGNPVYDDHRVMMRNV
jgi:enoyl-[acyl-carrier-protein] reductase (NADH)